MRAALAGAILLLAVRTDASDARASAAEYVRTGMALVADGGLLDWSHDGSAIFYDHLEADGDYDVWRMDADGSSHSCVTCDHPQLPNRDQGNPVVHPDGRYVVFQAEQAVHESVPSGFTEPGFGRFNDLWAIDLQTNDAYKLTDVGSAGWQGTLQPQFSNDGSKLLWGQLEGQGTGGLNDWGLIVADWVTTPVPHLENPVTYNPGPAPGWLEVHGWSADDSWIYITCTAVSGMPDSYMDTCRMSFDTPTQVTRLNFTSGMNGEAAEWEDHSQLTPAGDVYAYIATEPYGISADAVTALLNIKSDVWLMNTDGSGRQRITYFNEPGNADYLGVRVVASELRWSPDGTKLAARIQTPSLPVRNHIYIIDLARNVDGDGAADASDTGDTDGDGRSDKLEHFCGADTGSPAGMPERTDGVFAGADDDGDDSTDEPLLFVSSPYDCDGDGFTGAAEFGTPLCGNGKNDDGVSPMSDDGVLDDGCPGGPAQVGTFSEAQFKIGTPDQDPCGNNGWPLELFSGAGSVNQITLQDLTSFLGGPRRFGTSPGNPDFSSRWDLLPGGAPTWINLQDFTAMIAAASSTGKPPMLGGARAFGSPGPVCPWP